MKPPNLNHCFKFSLISLLQAFLSTLSIFVMKKWQSEALFKISSYFTVSSVLEHFEHLCDEKVGNLRHCFKFSLISLLQAFLSTLSMFVMKKWQSEACPRSAGCQLSVKSGFKSIGPCKVEKVSEMSLRNVIISKFHIPIHLHCLHTWL